MQKRRALEKKLRDQNRREAEERAKRRDRERKLLAPLESRLKGSKLPMRLARKVREWKKSERPAKEILKSLSERELGELETDLV